MDFWASMALGRPSASASGVPRLFQDAPIVLLASGLRPALRQIHPHRGVRERQVGRVTQEARSHVACEKK
jgi:hypothetical protein